MGLISLCHKSNAVEFKGVLILRHYTIKACQIVIMIVNNCTVFSMILTPEKKNREILFFFLQNFIIIQHL